MAAGLELKLKLLKWNSWDMFSNHPFIMLLLLGSNFLVLYTVAYKVNAGRASVQLCTIGGPPQGKISVTMLAEDP